MHAFDELFAARQAMLQGNPRQAAVHLARQMQVDPAHEDLPTLIQQFCQRSRAPLSLVSEDKAVGPAALRAAVMAELGRTSEAVALMLRVQAAVPSLPFLPWLERFTRTGEIALDPEVVMPALLPCMRHDAVIAGCLPLLQAMRSCGVQHRLFGFVFSKSARRAGESDLAIEVAREMVERVPSWHNAIGLAMALQELGQEAEAIKVYQRAAEIDPTDASALLDAGDLSLALGQRELAAKCYQEALGRDDSNEWATASLAYVRVLQSQDESALALLRELAHRDPVCERARDLFDRLEPYTIAMEPPSSSVINSAVHCIRKRDGLKKMGVSSMEPPSAVLAARRALGDLGLGGDVDIAFSRIPEPDPRLPLRPVDWPVWTYRNYLGSHLGQHPVPAVPRPADVVIEAISTMANSSCRIDAWVEQARREGARLGTDHTLDLLGLMAYIPRGPKDYSEWAWTFRVQVCAALVLAWIDDGWDGSERQRVLSSLVYGPVDWTTTAGIIAATALARAEPLLGPAVLKMLEPLVDVRGGPIHYLCMSKPLLACLPRVAGLPASVVVRLAEHRQQASP